MVGKVWINMIGNKKADCGDAISLLCVDLFVVMRLWLLFQPLLIYSWLCGFGCFFSRFFFGRFSALRGDRCDHA